MRLDKFTIKSQEALNAAQQTAAERQQQEITPEHLLIALMAQEGGVVAPVMQRIGSNLTLIKAQTEEAIAKLPKVYGGGEPYLSPRLNTVLDAAMKESQGMKDEFTSSEPILIATASQKRGEPA